MKPNNLVKNIIFSILFVFSSSIYAIELTNLELTVSDGTKHHLQDYLGKGKWTAIIVWGPKCPVCAEEMPEIEDLYNDRQKTNIDVIGLALDFPSFGYAKIRQVQQFNEDYFISFPSLLISSGIYSELGIGHLQGTPTIILVDPEGEVSAVELGKVPRDVIENYIAKQEANTNSLPKK